MFCCGGPLHLEARALLWRIHCMSRRFVVADPLHVAALCCGGHCISRRFVVAATASRGALLWRIHCMSPRFVVAATASRGALLWRPLHLEALCSGGHCISRRFVVAATASRRDAVDVKLNFIFSRWPFDLPIPTGKFAKPKMAKPNRTSAKQPASSTMAMKLRYRHHHQIPGTAFLGGWSGHKRLQRLKPTNDEAVVSAPQPRSHVPGNGNMKATSGAQKTKQTRGNKAAHKATKQQGKKGMHGGTVSGHTLAFIEKYDREPVVDDYSVFGTHVFKMRVNKLGKKQFTWRLCAERAGLNDTPARAQRAKTKRTEEIKRLTERMNNATSAGMQKLAAEHNKTETLMHMTHFSNVKSIVKKKLQRRKTGNHKKVVVWAVQKYKKGMVWGIEHVQKKFTKAQLKKGNKVAVFTFKVGTLERNLFSHFDAFGPSFASGIKLFANEKEDIDVLQHGSYALLDIDTMSMKEMPF
jgi:hypothetical protein